MANSKKKTRFIDNEEVRQRLSELHIKQLVDLQERLNNRTITPQEHRIIWDMVQKHGIGVESVEDLASNALDYAELNPDEIPLEEDTWRFTDSE